MRAVIASLALSFLLLSCQSYRGEMQKNLPEEDPFAKAQIQFIFEDIHPSFFKNETAGSLFLSVFIYYKGPRLQSNAIDKMRLVDGNGVVWTDGPEVNDYFVGGWSRFRTDHYSVDYSVLRVRQYSIQIVMRNGHVYKLQYDPAGSESEGEKKADFVYSAEYRGQKNDSYVQCLQRAQIKEFKVQDKRIKLSFTVNDRRVQTGQITFYNKNKVYTGNSAVFMNPYSLEYRRFLNKGAALFTNGTDNVIEMSPDDIWIEEGWSLSEVEYANVALTNNVDWLESPIKSETVFESRSEMFPIQKLGWNITNRWSSRLGGRSEPAVLTRTES